jgi:hypothetical protein
LAYFEADVPTLGKCNCIVVPLYTNLYKVLGAYEGNAESRDEKYITKVLHDVAQGLKAMRDNGIPFTYISPQYIYQIDEENFCVASAHARYTLADNNWRFSCIDDYGYEKHDIIECLGVSLYQLMTLNNDGQNIFSLMYKIRGDASEIEQNLRTKMKEVSLI